MRGGRMFVPVFMLQMTNLSKKYDQMNNNLDILDSQDISLNAILSFVQDFGLILFVFCIGLHQLASLKQSPLTRP